MLLNSRPRSVAACATSVLIAALAALLTTPARADVIYRSAAPGPVGQTFGQSPFPATNIDAFQYVGVRFQTDQAFVLTDVQIHASIGLGGNDLLFAAIVPLTDLNDFPDSGNPALVADDNPVEFHTFTAPAASTIVTVPFSSVLPSGTYGLVFGSGEFGATGVGFSLTNNTEIGTPSYFRKGGTGFFANGVNNSYFAVNGTPVGTAAAAPEPGTLCLLALGAAAGILVSRRQRRTP